MIPELLDTIVQGGSFHQILTIILMHHGGGWGGNDQQVRDLFLFIDQYNIVGWLGLVSFSVSALSILVWWKNKGKHESI